MDICKAIRKVVVKGVQKTHEQYLVMKKIFNDTIKQNFSAGEVMLLSLKKKLKKSQNQNAIAVVNCTEAIHITLKACGIKGDEVLVPSLTFVGTVNPISYLELPTFCESSLNDFGMTVKSWKNIYKK